MNDSNGRPDQGAPVTGDRPCRKDRPPLGRFLLMFAGLLAAALALASLAPAAPESERAEHRVSAVAKTPTTAD